MNRCFPATQVDWAIQTVSLAVVGKRTYCSQLAKFPLMPTKVPLRAYKCFHQLYARRDTLVETVKQLW